MQVEKEQLALQALLAAEIDRLPVKLSTVAACYQVGLFTYRDYARATETTMAQLADRFGADGFSQNLRGRMAVFYNDSGNPRRVRWTVAHELGHILLGHLNGGGMDRKDSDRHADALAAELLCPQVVVTACGCGSKQQLAELCDISQTAAECRLREIRRREERRLPEDELLLERFGEFIAERRNRPAADEPAMPRLRCRRL